MLFATSTNNFQADEYCAKLAAAYEEEKALTATFGWGDLLKQPTLRRLLIAVGIQCLQQAQGSSYMNSYIVSFLQVSPTLSRKRVRLRTEADLV